LKYSPQTPKDVVLYWTIWEQVVYGVIYCKTRILAGVLAGARMALVERTQYLLDLIAEIKEDDQFQVRVAVVRIMVALLTIENEAVFDALVRVFGSIEEMARRIAEVFETEEYPERLVKFGLALQKMLEFPGHSRESRRNVAEMLALVGMEEALERGKEICQSVEGGVEVFGEIQKIIRSELF
jgi:hypothetical protein